VCGVESIHGKKRQKRKSQYTSSAAATIIVNQKVKISSSVSLLITHQHTKHGEIDDSNGRFCP
jgi:hypothetical protein